MKNKAFWRTWDGRKICRICARRLKKARLQIPAQEAVA